MRTRISLNTDTFHAVNLNTMHIRKSVNDEDDDDSNNGNHSKGSDTEDLEKNKEIKLESIFKTILTISLIPDVILHFI